MSPVPTPVPPEQRHRFFVYVVESPSDADLYCERSEGELIQRALTLNGLSSVRRTVINERCLAAALTGGVQEAMAKHPGLNPILHISAHGCEDGIGLSSGELVSWGQLRDYLIPINRLLGNSLIVCMSSCQGYSGIRMTMQTDENAEHPYFALIGNGSGPTWPETAVAFLTLYHQLVGGYHLTDAVEGMRVASRNYQFFLEWSSNTRRNYIDYMNKRGSALATCPQSGQTA